MVSRAQIDAIEGTALGTFALNASRTATQRNECEYLVRFKWNGRTDDACWLNQGDVSGKARIRFAGDARSLEVIDDSVRQLCGVQE